MWVDFIEIWQIMSTVSMVLISMERLQTIQIFLPKIYTCNERFCKRDANRQ